MKHTGWRKPTPGLVQAERFAQAGEHLAVPKSQAIVAVKKVAAAIGLKSQDLLLLDTFGAVTQAQDWEQGRRPIVWASNNFLMEQTGFTLTTLRRHVRRLCEVGVISMKDSPNGKRWGRRDEVGHIVEAYGFDLSPLAARAEEFEALYAHIQEERAHCASLRNTITVMRRMIRAKIEEALASCLSGPWSVLQDEYTALLEQLPKRSTGSERLQYIVELFESFRACVEQAFEAAFDWPQESDTDASKPAAQKKAGDNMLIVSTKIEPTGTENGTHILTTNELNPVASNRFETKHAAAVEPGNPKAEQVEKPEGVDLDISWSTHGHKRGSDIDIPMLMASCPHFAEMARGQSGFLKDWNDVHRAAATLRPIVGISEDAWNVANQILGPAVAAASIALILDKSTEGEVKSPGGYLRGIVEKAQAGDLHLERSFYGRLNGQAA